MFFRGVETTNQVSFFTLFLRRFFSSSATAFGLRTSLWCDWGRMAGGWGKESLLTSFLDGSFDEQEILPLSISGFMFFIFIRG